MSPGRRAYAKLLLGFCQIASCVSEVFDVPMPDAVERLLSLFKLLDIPALAEVSGLEWRVWGGSNLRTHTNSARADSSLHVAA